MVVPLQVVAHAGVVQAGDERVLAGGIGSRAAAEQGVNVVLGDESFVTEDERVAARRFARKTELIQGC